MSLNDTIIELDDGDDECFVTMNRTFVAHGFDELRTEYSYTSSDVIESSYFDFDSANVAEVESLKISDIAKILKKNKGIRVLIVGNCDKFGKEEYNYSLGRQRADSVKNILTSEGVDVERITTASLGSYKADENAETKEDSAMDRRCDIVIHEM
jgi:outer membrane protein OmpA-like peptidoglycan-associated protein